MVDELSPDAAECSSASAPRYSLWQLIAYIWRLGMLGFGGPVALVGYMHRDLVEQRQWISEADYKEGLTLAQLMPGPLAAQLAIYLGYVHYGVLGATLVGVAFVVPSFLMVVALGQAYAAYGGLPWMQSVFYGVGACVIGIITLSAYKLTAKTIGKDPLLWMIYLLSAGYTIATADESLVLFLGAGFVTWGARRWRSSRNMTTAGALLVWPLRLSAAWLGWQAPLGEAVVGEGAGASPIRTALNWETLGQLALFFTKAGAFVFGSGLAIVPFLHSGVVSEYHWMTDQQFLDAVAVAMITPGPVVITVAFIGYHVAGLAGASVAALATFLPCYLLTILPAPYFKKHGKRPGIIAFVDGVTAAAIGAIAGAVVVLGQRTLPAASGGLDVGKMLICGATIGLLWRFKKFPEPIAVIAGALVGLLIASGG
ncbi:MAG: chromate transporter [Planctomycetes bacterium]|nr:chromate transporter [Planctomycetota bacterium]